MSFKAFVIFKDLARPQAFMTFKGLKTLKTFIEKLIYLSVYYILFNFNLLCDLPFWLKND